MSDQFEAATPWQDAATLPVEFVDLAAGAARASHIEPGDAHLWHCSTAITHAAMERLLGFLNQAERERALRMTHPGDRQRFVVGRGTLRAIVGNHLDVAPHDFTMAIGPNGRPSLGGGHARETLRFNVSHAGEHVMIALADGIDVGVDIEIPRTDRPLTRIAERVFGPAERETLDHAGGQYTECFYAIWTLREAFVKALGDGLTGWSGVDIACGADGQLSQANHHRSWLAHRIPGLGAVALAAAPRQIRAWKL